MPGFLPADLPTTAERGGFRQRSLVAGGLTVAFEDVPAGDYGAGDACPTPDHELVTFDAPPVHGRAAGLAVWGDYLKRFPGFVLYPSRFVEAGPRIGVLGSTTGSHVGLPDDQERRGAQLWIAEVAEGQLKRWAMRADTPENRGMLG